MSSPRLGGEAHERRPRSRPDHRLLVGNRAARPRGASPARAGTSTRRARRLDSIADLAEAGCETLALDVTDEDSMRAAVAAVEAEHGAVGALVNNAGYSQSGALETLPMERLRAPVRDQRLRPRAHVPAGAAGDARRRAGPDRQRELDGRQARLPRRRRLPRDQVRGRGALRRAALRGPRVRRPRRDHRAGPDHDQLRRDGGRLARRRRRRRRRAVATIPTRASTPRSGRRRSASTRAR